MTVEWCFAYCRYVEVQSSSSFHTKATMVRQAARSSYTCNEAAVGAAISRHDLSIEQVSVHQSTRLVSMSQKGVHSLSVYICRLQNAVVITWCRITMVVWLFKLHDLIHQWRICFFWLFLLWISLRLFLTLTVCWPTIGSKDIIVID